MWVEIVVLFVVFSIGTAQTVLNYMWTNRKTARYKRLRISLLVLMFIFLAGSVGLRIIDNHRANSFVNEIAILRSQNDSLIHLAQKGEEKAHEDMVVLQEEMGKLHGKLDPFLQIAMRKYPSIDTNAALSKLLADIKEVKRAVYVVRSLEVIVTLTFATIMENADIGTMRIALGKFNIAGLESEDGSFHELHSDEMVSNFTVSKKSITYQFVYKPAIGADILGKHIKYLKDIKSFLCNYTNDIGGYADRVSEHCLVAFHLLARINDISIGEKKVLSKYQVLTSGDMQLDISSIFKDIDKKYAAHIMQEE